MKSKTLIAVGIGLLAATMQTSSVHAGSKQAHPVTIGTDTVIGNLGAVRNSGDAVQAIGCQVSVIGSGMPVMGCFARDAAGRTVSCSSADASYAVLLREMTDDSVLLFGWDSTGACVYLHIANSSAFEPAL